MLSIDCLCPTNSSSGVRLSCDPFSGQCACPPNTIGLRCDMCADDTWDLDTDFGCKVCINVICYIQNCKREIFTNSSKNNVLRCSLQNVIVQYMTALLELPVTMTLLLEYIDYSC